MSLEDEYRRRFPPRDADEAIAATAMAWRALEQAGTMPPGAARMRLVVSARDAFVRELARLEDDAERFAWLLTADGRPTTAAEFLATDPAAIVRRRTSELALVQLAQLSSQCAS
jgi:hypothetical protein